MIISSPRNMNGIRVTKHTLDRINERLGLSASKSDIASEYFSMMANRKVFFIPDYQARFLGQRR